MTDLRKAAEMAATDLEELISWHGIRGSDDKLMPAHNQTPEIKSAIETLEALRQALAQAEQKKEQEPEWIDDGFGTMWQKCGKKDCGKFVVKIGKVDCWNGDCPETTAPPKREWVGLTEEEIDLYALDIGVTANKAPAWLVVYAKDIEAKLKEKNT